MRKAADDRAGGAQTHAARAVAHIVRFLSRGRRPLSCASRY